MRIALSVIPIEVEESLNALRIGCVKYLNARPLIRGWAGEVDFDHPSALCKRLADGELDVALVSSFEFLRNPIYRIVDDVSISSDGPVYSVIVAYAGNAPLPEIELDPASETSVFLLRYLIAERGKSFQAAEITSDLPLPLKHGRARLLIGDHAIRFRQKFGGTYRYWDLGGEWKGVTKLPFVYALWLVRPEVADPKSIANRLRTLRDKNLANLDVLIADETEFHYEFCSRYYREHLRFSFGENEKKSLITFADLCAKQGLLQRCDLALDLV